MHDLTLWPNIMHVHTEYSNCRGTNSRARPACGKAVVIFASMKGREFQVIEDRD